MGTDGTHANYQRSLLMSRRLTALSLFAATFALSATEVMEVPGSRVNTDVPVWSPHGIVRLPAAGTHITVRLNSGRLLKGNLAVVYDPDTHRFFWSGYNIATWDASDEASYIVYNWRSDLTVSGLFTSPDRITQWCAREGESLEVWTSTLTADSLDRAMDIALSYFRSSDGLSDAKLKHMSQRFIRFEDPGPRPLAQLGFGYPGCCKIEAIDPVDHGYRLRLRSKLYVGELVVGDGLEIKEPFRRLEGK
jgi:hypothetical protein